MILYYILIILDACMFDNLHVCENEGLCMEDEDNLGNVKCECQDGYGGLYCEESIPCKCIITISICYAFYHVCPSIYSRPGI